MGRWGIGHPAGGRPPSFGCSDALATVLADGDAGALTSGAGHVARFVGTFMFMSGRALDVAMPRLGPRTREVREVLRSWVRGHRPDHDLQRRYLVLSERFRLGNVRLAARRWTAPQNRVVPDAETGARARGLLRSVDDGFPGDVDYPFR